MKRTLGIIIALTVVALLGRTTVATAAATPQLRGKAIKLEEVSQQEFQRLPDSQLVQVGAKQVTAGEIRADVAKKRQAAMAWQKQAASRAKSHFEARKRAFESEQQAKIRAEIAKATAQMAILKRQAAAAKIQPAPAQGSARDAKIAKIREEAIELQRRYKTAPPAEKKRIEQRSAELLKQLQALGFQVPPR